MKDITFSWQEGIEIPEHEEVIEAEELVEEVSGPRTIFNWRENKYEILNPDGTKEELDGRRGKEVVEEQNFSGVKSGERVCGTIYFDAANIDPVEMSVKIWKDNGTDDAEILEKIKDYDWCWTLIDSNPKWKKGKKLLRARYFFKTGENSPEKKDEFIKEFLRLLEKKKFTIPDFLGDNIYIDKATAEDLSELDDKKDREESKRDILDYMGFDSSSWIDTGLSVTGTSGSLYTPTRTWTSADTSYSPTIKDLFNALCVMEEINDRAI